MRGTEPPSPERLMTTSDYETVIAVLLAADFGPDDAEADTLPAPPMSEAPATVKTCGCGLTYDAPSWAALPFVGIMRDEVEACELRNCACGSTIALASCVAPDCRALATWTHGESGYCSEHINAPLMSEDRIDFADEWHRDVRREREVAA